MPKKIRFFFLGILSSLLLSFLPQPATAQSFLDTVQPTGPLVPVECRKYPTGAEQVSGEPSALGERGVPMGDLRGGGKNQCNFRALIKMLMRLVQWFFLILGIAAFVFFLYGGFLYVFSGGSSQIAGKGKDILVNTVIAIVIILGAYTGVKFIEVYAFGNPETNTGPNVPVINP